MNQASKTGVGKNSVKYCTISDDESGQRIDNYLMAKLKGVPKSKIYRIIRKGEVRVNKKRTTPSYKLQADDVVRIPPIQLEERGKAIPPSAATVTLLKNRILYEDDDILIINKPAGMSVHAGSTVRVGVIEALRHLYPKLPALELAHRLDAETSGCLVLAKKKRVLRELHQLLRNGEMSKIYWTLTKGKWRRMEKIVDVPLKKDFQAGGKHVVEVKSGGKSALTEFKNLEEFDGASFMEVKLYTGRTHQIRVHAAHQDHAIAGDDRYGDSEFNKLAKRKGLKRMFLHARCISFVLPSSEQRITVTAPLDDELTACLNQFGAKKRWQ